MNDPEFENHTPEHQSVDPVTFRQVLGHYPTGVVVVTAVTPDGKPMGMVVGTFLSVSLEPPLVGFLPTRASETFEQLRSAGSFCINVFADDQEALARKLARRDDDKFTDVSWTPSASGAPILDGVVAAIDCSFESIGPAGDHYFVLARVHDLQVVRPVAPLLFFQGGYGSFTPLSLVAGSSDVELIRGVRLAEAARREMERLATEIGVECNAYVTVGDDVALVAAAVAPGVPMLAQLGTRFPLMPPLGELFVAWEPEERVEAWLNRAGRVMDDDQRADYRRQLENVRSQGWALSAASAVQDSQLYEMLRRYSDRRVTPAQIAQLHEHIRNDVQRIQHGPIDEAAHYDLNAIVYPVRSTEGRVVMVLRLTQLPAASGAQVRRWIDMMQEAAIRVQHALAGAPQGEID